jgi:hypothetical protein
MNDRDFPEGSSGLGAEAMPDLNSDELSSVNELVAAARMERPDAALSERVLQGVAYRSALASAAASAAHPISTRRRSFLAMGALAAAAACTLFWLHRSATPPKIGILPERTTAPSAAVAQAGAPQPAVDPCVERRVAEGHQPVIDDFEDGDDEVMRLEGRSGLWRWVRDTDAAGTAPALLPIPRPNASAGNRMALHVKGGRLMEWGAVVEFNFVPPCYDASAYRGISFQAKGPGRLFVAPREVGVIPVANGGACVQDCHNAHVQKIELGSQWKAYEVLWTDVAQRGYSKPALDPSRLNSLAFQIHPEDTPYDIWLDQVRFLPR